MRSRKAVRIMVCAVFFSSLTGTLAAQPQAEKTSPPPTLTSTQRDLGIVILEDFSIKDGVLSFRTATGGCTDKDSFKISVARGTMSSGRASHFILTIERIKPDDCKAYFPEGVVVEYDLEKDLGLTGVYVVSLSNPMAPRAGMNY
jgi:hypothetical protein